MPLLKIHVEEAIWQARRAPLIAALLPIRGMLCTLYQVDASLAQLAIIPVFGVADQAQVAAEMQILPKPERTRALILDSCERLRAMLETAAQCRAVIRCTQLNPETYLALK